MLDRTAVGECMPRRRHREFLRFPDTIDDVECDAGVLKAKLGRGDASEKSFAPFLGPISDLLT
jgi:hypothetical protein